MERHIKAWEPPYSQEVPAPADAADAALRYKLAKLGATLRKHVAQLVETSEEVRASDGSREECAVIVEALQRQAHLAELGARVLEILREYPSQKDEFHNPLYAPNARLYCQVHATAIAFGLLGEEVKP